MKSKIHPQFNAVKVTCACGNAFETASTAKELKLEVCSNCHPFFTGTQRFVDTMGRVERFQARIDKHKVSPDSPKQKKGAKPTQAEAPAAPATTEA